MRSGALYNATAAPLFLMLPFYFAGLLSICTNAVERKRACDAVSTLHNAQAPARANSVQPAAYATAVTATTAATKPCSAQPAASGVDYAKSCADTAVRKSDTVMPPLFAPSIRSIAAVCTLSG